MENKSKATSKKIILSVILSVCFLAASNIAFADSIPTKNIDKKKITEISNPISDWPEITLTKEDRILILAPHPDDEIIACDGIIQRARSMNLPVEVIYLTYGDNNELSFLMTSKHLVVMPQAVKNMGLLRHDEGIDACKSCGLSSKNLIFLGYPDFATMNIWYRHWGDRPPAKGMLTRSTYVPYSNAFRPGAPFKGEEIVKDLQTCIKNFRPTKIFVSHPGDHNGDHLSLYLFTQIALWNLEKELKPQVYPYLVHFVDWPLPRGFNPLGKITPPEMFKNQIAWQSFTLTPQETEKKLQALKLYHDQFISSGSYLETFVKSNELFGNFAPIKLHKKKPINPSSTNANKDSIQQDPNELASEERSAFIGFQERTVRLEDDSLVVTINLSRPLGETVGLSVYAFGYRYDTAFEKMPKIQVNVGTITHKVYERGIKIPHPNIRVIRHLKSVTLTIPLKLLGDPEKILLSARTYLGNIRLDWLSWRVLEIQNN